MVAFEKRQSNGVITSDGTARNYDSWWYDTDAGVIAKWCIFFGLLFLFLAFVVIGRIHAMKRVKKGLQPLGYHRWLLSRRQRATYDPAFRQPQVYYAVYPQGQQPPNSYNMYPMPPPVYDPNSAPPNYQPPLGGTKVDPMQGAQISGVTQPVASQSTGASNNPYRQ